MVVSRIVWRTNTVESFSNVGIALTMRMGRYGVQPMPRNARTLWSYTLRITRPVLGTIRVADPNAWHSFPDYVCGNAGNQHHHHRHRQSSFYPNPCVAP
jgi:hypothetical protein